MMHIGTAYSSISKRVRREAILKSVFFLPDLRRRRLERRLRGREEIRTIRHGDVVVVSCGKCGETWLRTLVSRFFQQRFDLETSTLLSFDNYHQLRPEIPRVTFVHDGYVRYCTGSLYDKTEYRSKPTLLLIRHPADVVVSQYFQWKYRMRPHKKWLNEYPQHDADISTFDLAMDENAGLPFVTSFYNSWNRERRFATTLSFLRYEDLRLDTAGELVRVLSLMGYEPTRSELDECVAFGSFENMRKLEESAAFRLSGRSLRRLSKTKDENAFKVRRGKAGGWRDYFDAKQTATIERLIDERLDPGFGYRSDEIGRAAMRGSAAAVR